MVPLFIGVADSTCTLNRNTRRTSIQVGARHKDQFPTQSVELLLGSTRFQHPAADPDHQTLEYGSNKLWIDGESVSYTHLDVYKRQLEGSS